MKHVNVNDLTYKIGDMFKEMNWIKPLNLSAPAFFSSDNAAKLFLRRFILMQKSWT